MIETNSRAKKTRVLQHAFGSALGQNARLLFLTKKRIRASQPGRTKRTNGVVSQKKHKQKTSNRFPPMRISSRKTPTTDCFRSIPTLPSSAPTLLLRLIVLLQVLQSYWFSAHARTETMSFARTTAAMGRSLSFVGARNGRRPLVSLISSAPRLPMRNVGSEGRPGYYRNVRQKQQDCRLPLRLLSSSSGTASDTAEEESSSSSSSRRDNQRLRAGLEDYRTEESNSLGKSPSAILPDKVIEGICALNPPPATREDLLKVKGLGAKKLEVSGDRILDLVSQAEEFVTLSATGASSSSSSSVAPAASTPDASFGSGPFPPSMNEKHVEETVEQTKKLALQPDASLDSHVAPAPYAAPEDVTGAPVLDSYVAPSPTVAPSVPLLDSYVAPAPYSFDDDEDDDFEEDEISEELFGAGFPPTPTSDGKEDKDDDEGSAMDIQKLRKSQLKQDLKEYRLSQMEDGKAAYTVFTNAALEGIYASLPTTKSELLDVKGIGPKKLEVYGDDILAMVAPYVGMGFRKETPDGASPGGSESNLPIPPEPIDPESLTAEQRRAADMILGKDRPRQNVFVTGSAGTGKSHLLKYVVETLRGRRHEAGVEEGLVVGVCAPTGVAAVIVGGSTLHSFFGIGLGTGSRTTILNKVNKNAAAKTRIDETDILIIDECSMLSAELLETLDMVARSVRRDGVYADKPFGGMQVVAFGDFFQLPPVYRNDGSRDWRWRPFCFDSPVWKELGLSKNIVELQEVQRQKHRDFVNLLNKVRTGIADQRDIYELNQKCLKGPNNPLPNDGILPTRLYVLNKDVDEENTSRLEELKSQEVVCTATDLWRQSMPVGTKAAVKKKMKDSLDMELPEEVRLKVGAQVMLTRNKDLDRNLVNGSRGVVERSTTGRDGKPVPVVRFDSGIVAKIDPVESARYNPDGGEGCLVRMQVPLKLAWAITVHKSQGSTLTRASLDISSAFEYGQCYVALSRVRSLEGLWLERPAELQNIKVSPQVIDFFARNSKEQ